MLDVFMMIGGGWPEHEKMLISSSNPASDSGFNI